jgi:hypothetical protein
MFAAFDQLGPVICPSWYAWLLGEDFADGIPALFASIAEGGGTVNADSVQERVWSALTARYYLDDATDEQVRHLRKITDRDLHRAIGELVALGALAADEANGGTLRLTPLADWAPTRPVRRPGTRRPDRPDQRHAAGHRPARVAAPACACESPRPAGPGHPGSATAGNTRFGWRNWSRRAGRPISALAGARACPPEDCGGTPGYTELIDTLADPDHPGHQDMLRWLGIEKGIDFDPARFDPADATACSATPETWTPTPTPSSRCWTNTSSHCGTSYSTPHAPAGRRRTTDSAIRRMRPS